MRYKKKKHIVLLVLLVILAILGLLWLSISIIILVLLYWGINYVLDFIKYNFLKKLCKGVFSFLILFCIAIGVRMFIVDIYLIPSSSMENTLYPKDVILVNKLKYGPNLPRSPYEIPWINLYYLLQDNSKKAVTKKHWSAKRLTGTSPIKQGDVIVYKYFSSDIVFVKRCVALAGDTIKIIDGEVYTNSLHYKASKHIRNTYAFKIKSPKTFYSTIDSLKIDSNVYTLSDDGYWKEAELSYLEKETLQTIQVIDSVKPIDDTNALNDVNLFPKFDKKKEWTLNNYGDLIIPKRGMTIQLTNYTFRLYKGIIKHYENVIIKRDKNNVFKVKGKPITSYTFKKNYYFVLGDNRKDSRDSRYIGFLPEEKIIGKVSCVLFSNKDDVFQWNRLFKGV